MYAEVILNNDALEMDRKFTYLVPQDMESQIDAGYRVKVPFGLKNKLIEGFVFEITEEEMNVAYKIKEIHSLCDKEPILSERQFKIIEFLKSKTLCKYIDAVRLMIPAGIMSGFSNKEKQVVCINDYNYNIYEVKENYKELYMFIKKHNGEYTKNDITKKYGYSLYMLNKLIKEHVLKVNAHVVFRYNVRKYKEDFKKNLNEEQQQCLNSVINSKERKFLIKGVTGSGKTEVYMRITEEMLKKQKGVIVLVPEIALTPQMIERFKGRFGENVALFHSKLSVGERFDEWYRVKEGKAQLVIGARSALFLPVKNLGLIIMDEEHENTYKSENSPKYHARECAEYMSDIYDCKLVLGSATPSIESFYKAKNNEYKLLEMNNRANKNRMPHMEIVDMREEIKNRNMSLFSRRLYEEIDNTLKNKKQIILFLNRRGFSTFISCRSCGYVFKCPVCDVSMTYHRNGYLICHYCGRAQKVEKQCPQCRSKYVKFFGAGTERVEMEVKKYFTDARVIRMDVDTTRSKNSYESIYNVFKNGEADILIGTQMVSKGLDFKNVTLVGILAADMSLNMPDYRSAERTYQIITQVAGRAGRGELEGKVIVQSYTPEHYSLKYAKEENYEGLFKEEIKIRQLMNNPPFAKILVINGSSKNQEKLKEFMHNIESNLRKLIVDDTITMYKPVPCIINKINGNYRWQIVIKGKLKDKFNEKIKSTLYEMNKSVYNEIRISIDINPNNMT